MTVEAVAVLFYSICIVVICSEQSNEKFNTATLHNNKTTDKKEENLADDGTGKVQVRLSCLLVSYSYVVQTVYAVHLSINRTRFEHPLVN